MTVPADVGLPQRHRGKVRDVYDAGGGRLLLVASDRISAFDVVLPEPVPDKGRVLTAMSAFWFDELADVVPHHLLATDLDALPEPARQPHLAGRVMLVREAAMLPIECIVRGYLSGSAWKEYRRSGTVHGQRLPEGLVESDRLAQPVFTPSTKASEGHDVNISFDEAVALVGGDVAERVRAASLELYRRGAQRAAERGIIIADTKFEFGLVDGEVVVADELLTPDSSRFWPLDRWEPGRTPPSFDKQPVRDALDAAGWDHTPPAPSLSPEAVAATRRRYVEAYERITDRSFTDWPGVEPATQ